jgi:hypothetical protein
VKFEDSLKYCRSSKQEDEDFGGSLDMVNCNQYQVTAINDESYARQQDKIQMHASGDGGLDTPLSWSVAGMRNQCSEAYNYLPKLVDCKKDSIQQKLLNFSEFSLPLRVVILDFKTLVYFSTVYDNKNLKIEEPIHAKCYSIGFEAAWPV